MGDPVDDEFSTDNKIRGTARMYYHPSVDTSAFFGSAPLREAGQPHAYDDGIALVSASHPVDRRWHAPLRVWWRERWFNLRVDIGFTLAALAGRISPVRPWENDSRD